MKASTSDRQSSSAGNMTTIPDPTISQELSLSTERRSSVKPENLGGYRKGDNSKNKLSDSRRKSHVKGRLSWSKPGQMANKTSVDLRVNGQGNMISTISLTEHGPEMEGFLLKWTNYVLGHQERYFVVQGNALSYYRNQNEIHHACRGTVLLRGATVKRMDTLSIYISTASQTLYLKAHDELDLHRWLTALEMGKSHAQESEQREFDEDESSQYNSDDETSFHEARSPTMNDNYYENREGGSKEGVRALVADLRRKLDICKEKQDVVRRETSVMQSAFTQIDSRLLNQSQKLRIVHQDGATLYTIVAGELVTACRDFYRAAEATTKDFEKKLARERRKRERVEQTLSDLARQHRRLETRASHIARLEKLDSSASFRAADDSDDEFYDVENDQWVDEYEDEGEHTRKPAKDVSSDDSKSVIPKFMTHYRQKITYRLNKRINFWSVLKNFIGKDLSKIPMPVEMNEPLSMLQRLSEDLEYSHLLNSAAKCKTQQERMCYIAAYTVSSYATTYYRTNKPFNPLLGETFELDLTQDPAYGWRTVAEQVSHHPPVAAMYTESDEWEMCQQFSMSSKFRGKYLSIVPTGISWIRFKKTNEKYTWTKVTTCVNNIIIGKLWIDQYGDMVIKSHTTKDIAKLKFIPYSYFSNDIPRSVVGTIENGEGKVSYNLKGTWDISMSYSPTNAPQNISTPWTVNKLPEDADRIYGYGYFACMLNDPRGAVCVAPTDSRLRPDLRALDSQDYPTAEREKLRLEEKQRATRKQRETDAISYSPRWFIPTVDPDTERPIHAFTGQYWKKKEQGDWSDCHSIY
eukprot:CFRG0779T1